MADGSLVWSYQSIDAGARPMSVKYKPLSDTWLQDPYPFYDRLRIDEPVHWSSEFGAWVVTQYDDAVVVLTSYRDFSSHMQTEDKLSEDSHAPWVTMLTSDPPEHGRLRRVVQALYSRARVAALEPTLQQLANQLIDTVESTGQIDIVKDFTDQYTLGVAVEILGLPNNMLAEFKQWSDDFIIVEGGQGGTEERDRMRQAYEFFQQQLAEKRRLPSQDVLTTLVAEIDQGRFTEKEAIDTCVLLIVGSASEIINNAADVLANQPDLQNLLSKEPALIPDFIEEVLRNQSQTQTLLRRATRDVELGGTQIRAGDSVFAVIGAANWDPHQFDEPARVDIARNPDHLGFGAGPHMCIGQHLARLEARVAIEVLLSRLPGMKRHPGLPAARFRSYIHRCFDSLVLVWEAPMQS
jgi:cytochrome P450